MKAKRIVILEKILCLMAKAVLKRHSPKIVAITGSVGKTSTKAAVFAVLCSKFETRENQKNYNNEIGIPLTIIGAASGGKNIFRWLWVFLKWLWVLIFPSYPEFLVLELGVDRPGDMQYFMTFIHPTVSIVTNISLSHIEYFKTVENIAKEKGFIVESLNASDYAILNFDDKLTKQMAERTKAQVLFFGQEEGAMVHGSNIVYNYENQMPNGISFKLDFEGKNIPIRLKNIMAAHQVYAALAAASTGLVFKIHLVDIAKALEQFHSPSGRMNLFSGIKASSVIDDTYNASPISTVAALDVLSNLKANRKVAILGDMLELGNEEKSGHREVGQKIFDAKIDFFVAVGRRMKSAVDRLVGLGYPMQNVLTFKDPDTAAQRIEEIIKPGDLILVKGSQGMRMEKIAEKLLANEEDKKLLSRQSKDWKKRPFGNP